MWPSRNSSNSIAFIYQPSRVQDQVNRGLSLFHSVSVVGADARTRSRAAMFESRIPGSFWTATISPLSATRAEYRLERDHASQIWQLSQYGWPVGARIEIANDSRNLHATSKLP